MRASKRVLMLRLPSQPNQRGKLPQFDLIGAADCIDPAASVGKFDETKETMKREIAF
jgi:hypothetical protein